VHQLIVIYAMNCMYIRIVSKHLGCFKPRSKSSNLTAKDKDTGKFVDQSLELHSGPIDEGNVN
jgi:hypothetical protein